MEFGVGVLCRMLLSKHVFRENRPNDSYLVKRIIAPVLPIPGPISVKFCKKESPHNPIRK
jgi:hypothetical protein